MRRVSVAERRARVGIRHHLAPGHTAGDAATVASSLVALHGTDPASVFLAVQARAAKVEPTGVEAALYDQRSLIRMLGMRRTMFVVAADVAPVVQAA